MKTERRKRYEKARNMWRNNAPKRFSKGRPTPDVLFKKNLRQKLKKEIEKADGWKRGEDHD